MILDVAQESQPLLQLCNSLSLLFVKALNYLMDLLFWLTKSRSSLKWNVNRIKFSVLLLLLWPKISSRKTGLMLI